ncbi:MAG: hypothetical protein FWC68_02105 [Oscillospiraceae bacterium]|nr:hypothetical protein [Oscillospiraceae bacterium]
MKKQIKIIIVVILVLIILASFWLFVLQEEEYMPEIEFEEINSSELDFLGQTWEERGGADWEQERFPEILIGQMQNREDGENVGNSILRNLQSNGYFPEFELMIVRHDVQINLWIFVYFEPDPFTRGFSFQVAVDGNTGQILRMWLA